MIENKLKIGQRAVIRSASSPLFNNKICHIIDYFPEQGEPVGYKLMFNIDVYGKKIWEAMPQCVFPMNYDQTALRENTIERNDKNEI